MKRRLNPLLLLVLCSQFAACGESDPPGRDVLELVEAFVQPEGLAGCFLRADGGELRPGVVLEVVVKGYENAAATTPSVQNTYSFAAGLDVAEGEALRFPVRVPKDHPFELEFTAKSPECSACTECASSCDGSVQVTDRGTSRSDRGASDGATLAVTTDLQRECECQTEALCAGGGSGGAGGEGGASGSSGAGGAGGSTAVEPNLGGAGGDAGSAGAAGSDVVPVVDTICGPGMRVVGEYATWCGKVNVHTVGVGWVSDSDCMSSCSMNTVSYCQKLWPVSTAQAKRPLPSPVAKPFQETACGSVSPGPGFEQYACCAPLE